MQVCLFVEIIMRGVQFKLFIFHIDIQFSTVDLRALKSVSVWPTHFGYITKFTDTEV